MKFVPNIKNSKGQILIFTVLGVFILLGVSALTIDLGIAYAIKAKLSSAVDAASLAGGKVVRTNGSQAEATAAALAQFKANFPSPFMGATVKDADISTVATHTSDGGWTIQVSATVANPSFFSRIFNQPTITVGGNATTSSRTVDLMLVLDCSGSMSGSFSALQAAATKFITYFNTDDDRIGLVTFSSGAVLKTPISKSARGFNRATVNAAISAAAAGGATNSGEAMRIARAELNEISPQNSLRAILFFSDGSPNVASGTFAIGISTIPCIGGLSASPTRSAGDPNTVNNPIYHLYEMNNNQDALGNTSITTANFPALGNYTRDDVASLSTVAKATANQIDLLNYVNPVRTVAKTGGNINNDWCNVNKAARNQLEYCAAQARNDGIIVLAIGLGSMGLESTDCGGYSTNEYGSAIMQRLIGTTGMYVNGNVFGVRLPS